MCTTFLAWRATRERSSSKTAADPEGSAGSEAGPVSDDQDGGVVLRSAGALVQAPTGDRSLAHRARPAVPAAQESHGGARRAACARGQGLRAPQQERAVRGGQMKVFQLSKFGGSNGVPLNRRILEVEDSG